MRNGPLHDLVSDIIAEDQRANGATTLRAIRATALMYVQPNPLKYGLGSGFVLKAYQDAIEHEAKKILKGGLYAGREDELRNMPRSMAEQLGRLPHSIARGEGRDPRWVGSLHATAEDWEMNANLKAKKAEQTTRQADVSREMADYLRRYDLRCLADSMGEPIDA